jgi:predicted transcriptional regulator
MAVEATLGLDEVRAALEADALVAGPPGVSVQSIGAADLMSDVLAMGSPGMLLLTGLVSTQTVRTAAVADCAGIVFVRDKRVPDEVLALAREAGIPVLGTRFTLFEASGRLYVAMLARREAARTPP